MTLPTHRDWWILGCEPMSGSLLVKCLQTQRTGVMRNSTPEELLLASAKNFEPYRWVEPDRVEETPLKPHILELAKKSQRLSPYLTNTQALQSRRRE